jgi:hypothetical protein
MSHRTGLYAVRGLSLITKFHHLDVGWVSGKGELVRLTD